MSGSDTTEMQSSGVRSLLTAFVLLMLISGCSDDGSEAPVSTSSSTTQLPDSPTASQEPTDSMTIGNRPATEDEILRANVQSYSDAFLTGDARYAFAVLSPRCREVIGKDRFFAIVAQAGDVYASALPFKTYEAITTDTSARITYTFTVSAIDQSDEPWVKRDGLWLNDDC